MSQPPNTVEEKPTKRQTEERSRRHGVVQPTLPHPKQELGDEPGFLRRNSIGLIIGCLLVGGGAWLYFAPPRKSEPMRKVVEPARVVTIQLPPPPPPPPPPKIKPPEPPKDVRRLEQPPEAKPQPKPAAPKPVEKPPEGLGTNIKGPGEGFAGLGGSGNGVIGGSGTGRGGGGNGAGREYATRLSTRLAETLRTNPRLRNLNTRVEVRVWVDARGRVTRAVLIGSTGDPALDTALASEIIPSTQVPDGPPRGLGMPITLRINVSRPR